MKTISCLCQYWITQWNYRISSNNSRPSVNRLPRIIAPTPLANFCFFYPLPVKLKGERESDPGELISDDSSSVNLSRNQIWNT